MFSKYWHNELIPSRSCHGLRGKCTGHGEKYGDHWKERKTWHFNYTPLILGKLYRNGREHGKLSPADFFHQIVETCRKLHFLWIIRATSALCSRMLRNWVTQSMLTPIWWLPLFQVSGEKGKSDTESHLQESPRYNIPLSGTTRLDSLSSSVANGELRWSRSRIENWDEWLARDNRNRKLKHPRPRTLPGPSHRAAIKKCYKKQWSSP